MDSIWQPDLSIWRLKKKISNHLTWPPFPSSCLPPLQSESKCEVFVIVVSSTLNMNEKLTNYAGWRSQLRRHYGRCYVFIEVTNSGVFFFLLSRKIFWRFYWLLVWITCKLGCVAQGKVQLKSSEWGERESNCLQFWLPNGFVILITYTYTRDAYKACRVVSYSYFANQRFFFFFFWSFPYPVEPRGLSQVKKRAMW